MISKLDAKASLLVENFCFLKKAFLDQSLQTAENYWTVTLTYSAFCFIISLRFEPKFSTLEKINSSNLTDYDLLQMMRIRSKFEMHVRESYDTSDVLRFPSTRSLCSIRPLFKAHAKCV